MALAIVRKQMKHCHGVELCPSGWRFSMFAPLQLGHHKLTINDSSKGPKVTQEGHTGGGITGNSAWSLLVPYIIHPSS